MGEEGRDGISDLDILLGAVAAEQIVVREGLKSSRFPNREASALHWIRVNKVVSVLADMACDRGTRSIPGLDGEAIGELAGVPVAMMWREFPRKFGCAR